MGGKHEVALIGHGYWGKKLFMYLQESEEFNLRYVHFRSMKGFDSADLMWDIGVEFVPSFETVLDDEAVKSVVIATPIDTHFELALQALEAGKHVLVEKPLAETAGEAWMLQRVAADKNLCLMTDFTWTFSKGLGHAVWWVGEGRIGTVRGMSITMRQWGRFMGQGVYAMLGVHALSILDMFVPLGGCTFSATPMMSVEGVITGGIIEVTWSGGCGHLDVSLHCPVKERRVVVYGDRGSITWDAVAKGKTVEMSRWEKGELRRGSRSRVWGEGDNLRYMLEEFSLVLRGKESNVELAVKVTEVLEGL